jgi:zinc/manganese transport system substrate-binding protein
MLYHSTEDAMRFPGTIFAVSVLIAAVPAWAAQPIGIVAAENFYGDVAKQIGGNAVKVTSILTNPDQDPHLFEASPSIARSLSGARIVVYNGLDYDPWMEKLLGASKEAGRKEIVVGDLIGKKPGDNPHIWYDTATMIAFATALTNALDDADPANKNGYDERLATFIASLKPLRDRIGDLRDRLAGTPVTATEPVFGYMFAALGMDVRNMDFQLAVMNNTEPSASQLAAFEDDVKNHRVKLLVYNAQASDPVAEKMMRLAKAAKVPIVGAAETEPPGKTYQAWMTSEVEAVDKALPKLTQ